ncbi:hypothetical protein [Flavobacterium urocaniciphilum]|uniref:Uncharacterized protein n=1 Tax=Flavobacterium urocaniciphilum TaxID=1299341 RepID=A0A1H9B6P1_9FLAO|nr:hypothetical protein [Flavobacterium urocaniciphilum]SEP84710.1 hypothetical protein SAMN05444005_102535 [Flavobacterium urocaniciphilum]
MKNLIFALVFLFSNVILAQEKSNLIYKEGIYSIEVKLEKDYLELGKENQFKIITKNIEQVNLSAAGHNLRIKKGAEKNSSIWTVNPISEKLNNGKYLLSIAFRGKKGKLYKHEFLIEVK